MAPASSPSPHPVTSDRRYFVVRGRLWRMANPELPELERARLVVSLMQARRDVGAVIRIKDANAERLARQAVDAAKRGLVGHLAIKRAFPTESKCYSPVTETIVSTRMPMPLPTDPLGERGPPWWSDGAPDHNRRMVRNSPYAEWYATLDIEQPC